MENSQVGSCISYNYDVGYESLPLKNTVRDVKGKPVPGIAYCTHLSTVRRGGLTGCPTGLHPASAVASNAASSNDEKPRMFTPSGEPRACRSPVTWRRMRAAVRPPMSGSRSASTGRHGEFICYSNPQVPPRPPCPGTWASSSVWAYAPGSVEHKT
jgi:hypothetical protein